MAVAGAFLQDALAQFRKYKALAEKSRWESLDLRELILRYPVTMLEGRQLLPTGTVLS